MAHRDKRESGVAEAERTALVVLGMHRSGTSALTGILSRMGADLPRELMAPTDMNVKGFFESQKMMLLNDALLESAGFSWSSLQRFPEDWFGSPKATEFRVRAAQVLEDEFSGSYLFAMKDPRVCKLLPFWHRALEDANCRALHICVLRHPLDVAGSLTSRYDLETDYGLLMWLRHVLDAEAASRGKPRVFTSYERILEDWQREIKRLGEGLDLKWPRSMEMVTPEVLDFLSGELRHFAQPSEGARSRLAGGLDWIRQAYEIFERWAAEGESSADHPALDALRAGLDHAQGTLGAVAQHAQDQRAERQALRARGEALAAEVETVRAEALGHATNHSIEQNNRNSAEEKVKELTATLAKREETDKALTDALKKVSVLQGRNAALVSERDALHNSCVRLEAETSGYHDQLEENRHELHKMQSMLAQRGHELDELRKQVQHDTGELEALREELSSTEAERTRLQSSIGHLTRHLNELTRRASLAMRKELHDHLEKATRDHEAGRLEAEVKSISFERDGLRDQLKTVQEMMSATEGRAASEQKKWLSEIDDLRRQVNLLNTQILSSETNARRASDQARIIQEKFEASKSSYDLERKKVSEIKKKLSDAQRQAEKYSEILNSTSWRITSPLRHVKMFLTRRRNE